MSTDTREAIMGAARAAVQTSGYTALSFRELAKDVGIKSASVHYHFPTKGDLATALAARYADEAQAYLAELLESQQSHDQLLDTYVAVFRAALERDNRMCLCGMMAAEYDELPDSARVEVERFTAVNTDWLEKVFSSRHPKASAEKRHARALAIFAAIEGAQLVARGRGNIAFFDQIIAAYKDAGLFS